MRTLLSWSGGKDSALALHALRAECPDLELVGLTTTVSEEYRRVSAHGVREELLDDQASAVGLELFKVYLPTPPPKESCGVGFPPGVSNSVYERSMRAFFREARDGGIEAIAFGDIFLRDLKEYRESLLAESGLRAVFPLWERDSRQLAGEFVSLGFRAVAVAVNPSALDETWAGRELDAAFFAELPRPVDPCGENGEYHSFVFEGPPFRAPVAFAHGPTEYHEPHYFRELYRANEPAHTRAPAERFVRRPAMGAGRRRGR